MSAVELSDALGYSQRTIQRDLNVLESELRVPITYEGRRYRIMPGGHHPLGPVRFTTQEARIVHLAARLFARYSVEFDPDGFTALEKIADTLPPAMSRQVDATAAQLRSRPENHRRVEVMRRLTEAWAAGQTARIDYRSAHSSDAYTTDLDPYLIEPSASGGATYVVGMSSKHAQVRIFKVDRIQSVEVLNRQFQARDLHDIVDQLSRSWGGMVFGDDRYDVTVDFSAAVAQRIGETHWHASQRLEPLARGGLRLRVVLPSLLEFVPWVLGWGADAVVVGPDELRQQVADAVRAMAANYGVAAAS